MLKKWFPLAFADEPAPQNGTARKNTSDQAVTPPEPNQEAPQAKPANVPRCEPTRYSGFEQIYGTAAVKPPKVAYGILKVADMVNSPHLAGMSPESKRNALMMALEAAGAEVGDVLQDVVIRQRALNDFEESLQEKVRQFEASQAEQNRLQQEELDRLTNQYMARIQANLDDVARSQDSLRAWQRQKQQELQRLTEAAAFCVPQGTGALEAVSSMVPVQERAAAARR